MKRLSALILAIIISCMVTVTANAQQTDIKESNDVFIYGDLDSDGKVTVLDATVLQYHIAAISQLSDEMLKYADVNADLNVSILDATTIQSFVSNIIEDLPANIQKVHGVTAVATTNTVEISWYKTVDATKYWVYKNDACYLSTTDTSIVVDSLNEGTTYEFYVTALLSDGTIFSQELADRISVTTYDMDTVGTMNGDYSIELDGDLPDGTYTLRYEDKNGVMTNCQKICRLTVTQEDKTPSYNGFIKQNIAPIGCTKIGVYDSNAQKVGVIKLAQGFQNLNSDSLYSFSATSDIHLGYDTAESDFINALNYFNNTEQVDFHTICGDLAVEGLESELAHYKSLVDTYSPDTPVYVAAGNHEEFYANSEAYYKEYTGNPLYYYFTKGEDVFIFVGVLGSHENNLFANGELQWLYEVLEENRNKRCFVFQHIPVEGGSGDVLSILDTAKLADEPSSIAFKNLMSHYKNVIHFHGHTHFRTDSQEYDKNANYDSKLSTHSVHIPSLSNPRIVDPDNTSSFLGSPESCEGYVVDVFEDGILLRAIDLVYEREIPLAQYYLDTTIVQVEAGTFTDSTGIIKTN